MSTLYSQNRRAWELGEISCSGGHLYFSKFESVKDKDAAPSKKPAAYFFRATTWKSCSSGWSGTELADVKALPSVESV